MTLGDADSSPAPPGQSARPWNQRWRLALRGWAHPDRMGSPQAEVAGVSYFRGILAWASFWLILAGLIGVVTGSASAFFLWALDQATATRESHVAWLATLPVFGFMIGWMYHRADDRTKQGNNAVLSEWQNPTRVLPGKMAVYVLLGTLMTHLGGGSAGREGTAVQMGSALADQCGRWLGVRRLDRKWILVMGVSGGFASVFGTPLAGAVFALEVLIVGRLRYETILPSFVTAAIADSCCRWWGVPHAAYQVEWVPALNGISLATTLLMGILCGLTALVFSRLQSAVAREFQRWVPYAPLRPAVGGLLIVALSGMLGTTIYLGLGLPTIELAFQQTLSPHVFAAKILFTAITLGSGLKGGEVTPLFFIGATLGSAAAWLLPLPLDLLVAMGFVAVFAGATNTPLACTLMGIELFGSDAGVFLALACVTAYVFSGHEGIYAAQRIGSPKHPGKKRDKSKPLGDLRHKPS